MHKYTGKTYSRARKREASSATIFDDVQSGEETNRNDGASFNSTKNPFGSSLPKKSSWSRVQKAVGHVQKNSPTKNASKGSKKTNKLEVIEESDPFAFSDELDTHGSQPSSQNSSQEILDSNDKSTDDEAYSSSQESVDTLLKSSQQSSKRSNRSQQVSPFKSFLKNNEKSLSPAKGKSSRRFSALPTNSNISEEEELSEESEPEVPSVVRSSSWPQTSSKPEQDGGIRVKRKDKPLFTVIRNVKKVSECLESGEDQEFFDDVEYLLDGLQSPKLQTRCLSALDIASRCTSATFRINLRAHGIIQKIFKILEDAHTDKNLALCTAAIMFVLTQDRQNIAFDKFVLEMMMNFLSLNDVEDTHEKNHLMYVQKARSMFEKHMSRIPGAYLDLKDISASSLARESLLSITTQKTGSWFKEEIRTLGGLDHIVSAVTECVDWLAKNHQDCIKRDQDSQAKIQRINKCLKLLENVTCENDVNQKYLIQHDSGALARDLSRFIQLCTNTLADVNNSEQTSSSDEYIYDEATMDDCLFNTIKVFLNLSHDCDEGSTLIGQQQGLLASLLSCALQLPQHIESSKQFDLHVLSLGLLINLMEHSKQNIATLVQLKTEPCHESQNTSNDSMVDSDGQMGSVEALMQLFIVREKASRDTDQMTNALSPEDEEDDDDGELKPTKDGLGWICGRDIDVSVDETNKTLPNNDDTNPSSSSPKKTSKKMDNESLEDEIGKALVIANKHMEDSMVASYVALLLGCIVQGNKANEVLVRSLLPDKNFSLLIEVVKKFLGFMRLTSGTSGHAIEKILKVLQTCSDTNE